MITTRTIRRTNALHTWESVSFRFVFVIETIVEISKTEQKADRYRTTNVTYAPLRRCCTQRKRGSERHRLHNAYAMRSLGTQGTLSSGLSSTSIIEDMHMRRGWASQVFFLHKNSYFSLGKKKSKACPYEIRYLPGTSARTTYATCYPAGLSRDLILSTHLVSCLFLSYSLTLFFFSLETLNGTWSNVFVAVVLFRCSLPLSLLLAFSCRLSLHASAVALFRISFSS